VSRRAVFLDRDGVINAAVLRDGKPYPPSTIEELTILPGVRDSLEALRAAGYALVVVTNQPDVARGKVTRELVELFHETLRQRLPLDAVFCCFHDDSDRCGCRKPAPGLLIVASSELGIDLTQSFMIGDRWRDTDAGAAAGCRTVFVDYGYDERQPTTFDRRVSSLSEATRWILSGGQA
jgi:D-glycero-D-manno-heptose 1,7-bisphosphate phosphatase